MAGQIWSVPSEGGYLYSDELSDILRMELRPATKFRQLCDAENGTQKGLNAGDQFTWNVTTALKKQGGRLAENQPMPETNFEISPRSLTVTEAGNSVPYTGKLEMMSKQDVTRIIDKNLRNDARDYFDIEAYLQMDRTKLRVGATAGTATDSIVVEEGGVSTITNNVALGTGHVKAISDEMKERNIPAFRMDDYLSVSHPTTLRPFKNELETIHQYTETGISHIFNGEVGRYESIRFVEQNHIPKGGAADSAVFNPWKKTRDEWNNGKSSWAFFMGADTVTEAIVLPEEIRGKLPGDYGRSRGIAWYYLGGFGLVHTDVINARVMKWDSAA